jgi:hypothetical protein
MHFIKSKREFRVFIFLLVFLAVSLLSLNRQVQAQTNNMASTQIPNINFQNKTVYVSLWLINVYSFDYKSGSYVFDMYLDFFWNDPNIATADWYLMNGYPTYPGAKLLVESNYNGSVYWEFYRVRASLNTPLEPRAYPFDKISLPISIELLPHGYNVSLVWLTDQSGIGRDFKNVGWTQPTFNLTVSQNVYPTQGASPRVDMFIMQSRSVYLAFADTILPPLIFCIVSGVSFLFRMHESNAFSLRVGIATSMLITAVLFNINQQNSIPPTSKLTIYSAFIDSVFAFLAINLIITVLGYVQYNKIHDQAKVDKLNKVGFVFSLAVPTVIFLILFLLI